MHRSEDKLASKPANLTFEQAAAVAIYGSTALQALRDHGKVRRSNGLGGGTKRAGAMDVAIGE